MGEEHPQQRASPAKEEHPQQREQYKKKQRGTKTVIVLGEQHVPGIMWTWAHMGDTQQIVLGSS